MKHLENLGVQEMNANEMKEINGGIFGTLLLAALAFMVGSGVAQLLK